MTIPESLLTLAGFVFAHATWSISDLPEGESLVPLAIVETDGQRQLTRFEAETQAEAIAQAKAILAEHEKELDAWAFARDGQFKENGAYVDVLTVEAKAKGMSESVAFIQRYQPFSRGKFKLLGEPMVVVGGKVVPDAEAAPLIAQLRQGVQTHKNAAALWPQWTAQ